MIECPLRFMYKATDSRLFYTTALHMVSPVNISKQVLGCDGKRVPGRTGHKALIGTLEIGPGFGFNRANAEGRDTISID